MSAVQNAVQNGIENLSGTSISTNSHPGDGYRFQARTKDELLQSQGIVPAVRIEDLPPDDNGRIEIPPGVTVELPHRIVVPNPPKAKKPEGWVL